MQRNLSDFVEGAAMREGLLDKLYIGIDLREESAMLSYFHPGMERPATVSFVAGSSDYSLPMIVAKRHGIGQWVYGKDAERLAEEGQGTKADSLFQQALCNNTIRMEDREYQAKDLFLLFLKKILSIPNKLDRERKLERLVFAVRQVTEESVRLFDWIRRELGLSEEQFEVVDYKECFCFYHCNQEEKLQNHQAGLFDGSSDRMFYYGLEKDKRTKPCVVTIEEQELGKLTEDKDGSFLDMAQQAFEKRLVSAVYFVGSTFDGGWMQESLKYICRGRRAFLGKNLYSLGACFVAFQKKDAERTYVYLGDSEFKMNISLKVRKKQEMEFYSLVTAGENWYLKEHCCEVILDDTNNVELWLQHPYGREAKIENLELADLPDRPERTTRLRITVHLSGDTKAEIEIEDLGFGELYPSSGKVWKYTMEF